MLNPAGDTNGVLNAAPGMAAAGQARRSVMITGMRQIGSSNVDLLVEFELTVMGGALPPYPVTTRQAVSQLLFSRLRPGLILPAAVDASGRPAVWLDLTSIS